MREIYQLSLFELVNKIKSKEISCEQATKSYVERSSKSKKLNCYVEETFDIALKKAKDLDQSFNPDKKLFGAPIAVKDLFCTNGVQTTASSKMLKGFEPQYESTVTEKLWNEGANLLGKLNCDEYALAMYAENSAFVHCSSMPVAWQPCKGQELLLCHAMARIFGNVSGKHQ